MANPFADQFDLPTEQNPEQVAIEQGSQLAQENLTNQVTPQSQRSSARTPAPEGATSWNSWNVFQTFDGKKKLAPTPVEVDTRTLQEKKSDAMDKIRAAKEAKLFGTENPEGFEQAMAEAEAQGPLAISAARGMANKDAIFDTTSIGGEIGNIGLKALKSFTDIIDEDIIGGGLVNNIDSQSAAYTRQLENETQLTSERLTEANLAYEAGNEVEAGFMAMGAILDMGSIMGKSLWNHPGQVLDMLADSASFFVGGAGLGVKAFGAARDISYGLRAAKQGVLDYEAEHGVPPTGEAMGRIIQGAGMTAVLSRASAMILQGQGGLILKRPVNAVMDATANASKAAVQKLVGSVAGRRVANTIIDTTRVAGAVSRDAVMEGVEEVGQEYLESNFMQDKDLDAKDIQRLTEAGVSGFAMGGVATAPSTAGEIASTVKGTIYNNSSLDLQDARVRALLKKTTKKGKDSPEEVQAAYAEALTEQAKADTQAEAVTAQNEALQEKLDTLVNADAPAVANTAERTEYAELQAEIASIEQQLKESTAEGTVKVKALGKVGTGTAQAELTRLQEQLANTPEPAAELTPEMQAFRKAVQQLTPKQKIRAITAIKGAMGKNNNSLKQYARTKQAAEKLATEFKLTDEVRTAADVVQAEQVAEQKEQARVNKEFKAKAEEAAAKGEPIPNRAFEPRNVETDKTDFDMTPVKESEPTKADADASIIARDIDNNIRPNDGTDAPAWDARKPGETTSQAFGRMLTEYDALPEEAMKERTIIFGKMAGMLSTKNPDAIKAFKDGELAASFKAMTSVGTHLATGNIKNVMKPADFMELLRTTDDVDTKKAIAEGIFNSISQGDADRQAEFMSQMTPAQLAELAKGMRLSDAETVFLLEEGVSHRALAALKKDQLAVNDEIEKTGFNQQGDTGVKMSIEQHLVAMREGAAIDDAATGDTSNMARQAFVTFEKWAKGHTEERGVWIKAMAKAGYGDTAATKSKIDTKVLRYQPTDAFYEMLLKEDAIFRKTLADGYALLGEDTTGIEEWWEDGLKTNYADSAFIRDSQSTVEVKNYDMRDIAKNDTDANGIEIKFDELSAGGKANTRKNGNNVRTFGTFVKKGVNGLLDVFSGTNNLINRAGTDLDLGAIAGVNNLGEGDKLSTEQGESWGAFSQFHKGAEGFEASWKKAVKPYDQGGSLMTDFYSANRKDTDPNFVGILSAVAYDYIATQGATTLVTDIDDVDKLFGTKERNIPQPARQAMALDMYGKGIPRTALMRELGLAALRNYGLKMKHTGADPEARNKLATAMGHAILLTLVKQGILVESTLDVNKHPEFKKYTNDPSGKIKLLAIEQSNPGDKKNAPQASERISNSSKLYKQDGNILKLLGSKESMSKEAYMKAADIPVMTETVDGDNALSIETQEAIQGANSTPRIYKSAWANFTKNMGKTALAELDGFNNEVGALNIAEQMSVRGQNSQIQSNLDEIYEHLLLTNGAEWFVNHTIVSNQRTNIQGYGDYQKNKWVRMAMSNAGNSFDTITLDEPSQMDTLYSAFGSYMKGTHEHRVDPSNKSVKHLTLSTVTPAMRKTAVTDVIQYLANQHEDEFGNKTGDSIFSLMAEATSRDSMSADSTQLLTSELLAFAEKFNTESGAELVELVRGLKELHDAQQGPNPSFKSTFSGEADGTSNGVFLTLVQMGAFDTVEEAAEQLQRYGLTIKGFTGTTEEIAKDIYQYIGMERQAARALALTVEGNTPETNTMLASAQASMDWFIGDADARNTNKPHTMTTIYSMGIKGQKAEIAKLLQKHVITKMSEIAALGLGNNTGRVALVNEMTHNINNILRAVSPKPHEYIVKEATSIFTSLTGESGTWEQADFITGHVNTNITKQMENYAVEVEGPHLQFALEKVFGNFQPKAMELNIVANSIFTLSEAARDMLIDDAVKRALEAGDISETEGARKFLPRKYAEEIDATLMSQNLAAIMPSAQSELGNKETWMQLGKTSVAIATSGGYHNQGETGGVKGDSIRYLETLREGPGAGTGAVGTHAFDASVILHEMKLGVMGIHDALVAPALQLAEHSKAYNETLMTSLREYSHLNAASTQFVAMLANIARLSADLNPIGAEFGPDKMALGKIYKSLLIATYKDQKDVIAAMDYPQLLNAVNHRKAHLRASVLRQQEVVKRTLDAAESLNQMFMSEVTNLEISGAIDMHDLPDIAPVKFIELDMLDKDEGSTASAQLQLVVAQELAKTKAILASSEYKANATGDILGSDTEKAALETRQQWLADLGKQLARVLTVGHMQTELRKNNEYSRMVEINQVLENAFTKVSVLMSPAKSKATINTIHRKLHSIRTQDRKTKTYQNYLDSRSVGTEAEQVAHVSAELAESVKQSQENLVNAREEHEAVTTIKGDFRFREVFKKTGALRVFADVLAGPTNKLTLQKIFDTKADKSLEGLANQAAIKGLPAHVRKAVEFIGAAGSHYKIQVGGKKYETGELDADDNPITERNTNTELASKPFVITSEKGNFLIEIAPPSFPHSPFNNAGNMTRLAAALQLDTLSNSEVRLTQARNINPIIETDLLAQLEGVNELEDTESTVAWIKEIAKEYLTNPKFADKFASNTLRGKDALAALGKLTDAIGAKFKINLLAANTEPNDDAAVWESQAPVASDTVKDEQVGDNNIAEGKLGSIAGDSVIPAEKFDEIESANLAETLTMLGDTYGAESEEHANHLTNVMGVMGQAFNKIKLGIVNVTGKVQQGLYDHGRISLNVFDSKHASATSKLVATGHIQGAQEIFAHEVVHAGTGFALDNSPALYDEANALWQEVRDAVDANGDPVFTYEMFMPDGMKANSGNTADADMAKHVKEHMFDHIFTIKDRGDGKSNHVAEFIAYGNTNARFRAKLVAFEQQAKKQKEATQNTNFLGKLKNILNKVADFITRKSDTTDGPMIQRFDALTARLAANDAQHKGALMDAADFAANGAGRVFELATTAVSKSVSGLGAVMQVLPHDAVKNTGRVLSELAKGNVAGIMDGLDIAYDHYNKANHNWFSSMVSESLGRRKYELTTRRDIRRITASNDAMRQNIQDSVASAINSTFSKPLQDWELSDQRAITDVLLRNDISTLAYTDNVLDSLNMDTIQDLLANPSKVDSEIAALTSRLLSVEHMTPRKQAFYVRNARALGAFMATGKVVDDLLLNNATAIALQHGTAGAIGASTVAVKAHKKQINIIDQLASLYALRFTDVNTRSRVAEIVKAEPQGTAMLISSHYANKNDSRDTQFKDAQSLMLKGYLPDSTAENIELRLAPTKDADVLAASGWKVEAKLARDSKDKVNQDMQYYTRKTVGTTYHKGGFDLTGMSARGLTGTKISTMSPTEAKALGHQNAQAVAQRSKTVNNMYRPLSSKEHLSDADIMSGNVPNRMAPSLDSAGTITEYRYLVPNVIKDSVLLREINPANVMAKAHGQTKQRAGLITNTTPLVTTLKTVYDNLSERKKDTAIDISEASTDARGREIYRMLPKYIKEEIKTKWGRDRMLVPAAMLDPVFGNRSLSIESWLREPKIAAGLSSLVHDSLQSMFGNNVSYTAGYVQETIQQLVGEAKKAIIVKSANVLSMNVMANSALLIGMGVKPSDALHDMREAMPHTLRYQSDTENLFAIDMKISAMSQAERFTDGEHLQQRREQLLDALNRNPMHELMEAGAYVNIATQMGVSTNQIKDDYTWMEKIRNARGKYLNATVNKAIDEIALTDNSELYKMAVVGAQMSDFTARYALVKHLTKRGAPVAGSDKNRKFTTNEAIDSAMDVFVDFTGATSPELQLANDMGLVMFSKYRLRVANSLMAAADINPKGVLGLAVMDMALKAANVTEGITSVTGSMGMSGLLSSVTTPWATMSHIADNTLLSYLPKS